jgi:hypothetical protein
MCNLVNKSTKVGTVHRLEARVTNPQNSTHEFTWNLFYKYLPGGEEVQKETDIYPVAVPQKDSKLLFVGFQGEAEKIKEWQEGKHEVKVIGWVNRQDRLKSSNLKSIFHISITKEIIEKLSKPNLTRPMYITAPILEWKRQHR